MPVLLALLDTIQGFLVWKKKETDQKRGSEEKRRAKVWWKARIVVLVMICTGLIQWPERMDTGVNGVCVFAQPVSGETTEADAVRQADSEGSASIDNSQEKQLTDQLELTDLQSMVDEMLGENSFSVTEAFHRLLSGEEVLSEESVREFLHSLLFSSIKEKTDRKLCFFSYSRQFFPDLQVLLTTDRSVRSVFMLCIFLFLLC